ncbi:hypothetical protein PoB_005217000 [Plakobranchus ocellatus]|uniref:Secreted protein n=1 Tax=Plakobranchus ocellatus TaxID=259542 RepID=A0AAV4C2N6_9GAST|nr:hypothetical protein PoB_005217000 [Plakobranchus ocellatus]
MKAQSAGCAAQHLLTWIGLVNLELQAIKCLPVCPLHHQLGGLFIGQPGQRSELAPGKGGFIFSVLDQVVEFSPCYLVRCQDAGSGGCDTA